MSASLPEKRRGRGANTTDSSRGSLEYHQRFWLAWEDPACKWGNNGRRNWTKLAEILGDDDKEKTRSVYSNTWQRKDTRKECGECPRCNEGEQCVFDLESFNRFMKTEKGRNAKFGRDAMAAANAGKHR